MAIIDRAALRTPETETTTTTNDDDNVRVHTPRATGNAATPRVAPSVGGRARARGVANCKQTRAFSRGNRVRRPAAASPTR